MSGQLESEIWIALVIMVYNVISVIISVDNIYQIPTNKDIRKLVGQLFVWCIQQNQQNQNIDEIEELCLNFKKFSFRDCFTKNDGVTERK